MSCMEKTNACCQFQKERFSQGGFRDDSCANAQTFIDMRTDELMLNWRLCMEGKDVVWIDPIR